MTRGRSIGGLVRRGAAALRGAFDALKRGQARSVVYMRQESPDAMRQWRDLSELVLICEQSERDNPTVKAIVNARTTHIVGANPRVEAQSDDADFNSDAEEIFRQWCDEADAYGTLDFWGLTRGVCRWQTTNTGALVQFIRDVDESGRPVETPELAGGGRRLVVVEGVRIRNPWGRHDGALGEQGGSELDVAARAAGATRLVGGVELDEFGRRVGYRVADYAFAGHQLTDRHRIPVAEAVLVHGADALRPGQQRGEPLLTAMVHWLNLLNQGFEKGMISYEIATLFGLVHLTDNPGPGAPQMAMRANGGVDAAGLTREANRLNQRLRAAGVFQGSKDDRVFQVDPKQPSMPFVEAMWAALSLICAALGVSPGLVFKYFPRNYHASRSEIALAWMQIEAEQLHLISSVIRPAYRWVIAGAIKRGKLSQVRGWDRCTANLGRKPLLDEEAETRMMASQVAMGIRTSEDAFYARGGTNWDAHLERLAAERRVLLDMGIVPGQLSPQISLPNTPDDAARESESRGDEDDDRHRRNGSGEAGGAGLVGLTDAA